MTAQEDLTGMPTPGPWKSNGYQITDPEGIRLADCWFGPNRPFHVAEANAALIVKAVNAYGSTDIAKAALSGSPAPSTSARYPEETGWLVEMNDVGPKYYSFSERDPDDPWGGFQRDPNKAIRFARKEDAEAMIAAFGWTPGHVYAAEHIWGGEKIAGSPAPSSPSNDLIETLREIEKQCIQADDPEHHTLNLVKHMARNALKGAGSPAPSTEGLREALANLAEAAHFVSATKFDTYKKGNGHSAGIEADDGEKCWIVHSDQINSLEWALKAATDVLASVAPIEAGWIVGNGAGTQWRYWTALGPSWTSDREIATRYARREDAEAVHAGDEDAWIVQPYTRTALAGVTAPEPDIIEELIIAAYKRGFHWCVENASDPEAAAYVGKAARDYADKTMNAPSAGITAPSEVEG